MFNTLVKRTVTYAVKTGSKCGSTVPRAVIARNASNRKRVAIDGNEAAAHSIYQVSDAAMLFPITPSSGMGEHCDNWANKGLKNVFGQTVTISEMQVEIGTTRCNMQSEAGAAGALHGTLTGGLLGATFSSSQGLMLMIPNMHKIAGELLPGVIHVSSRSISRMTTCLYCDYGDVFQTRAVDM